MFKPKVDTTRSDILQGQAIIRGVKKWLIRGGAYHNFGKWTKGKQTDRQKETRTTIVVRNAGCVRSRYTLKFFLINESMN